MADHTITVEVIYVSPGQQILRQVEMAGGSTVMQAINASGISDLLPSGAISPDRLGIHARKIAPDQVLHDGDRIEIYRLLALDPMEARRRRAREK